MKLSYLGSLVSIAALTLLVPACGDDDSSSSDDSADDDGSDDDEADAGDDDGSDDDGSDDDGSDDDGSDDDGTDDGTDDDSDDDGSDDDGTDDDGSDDGSAEGGADDDGSDDDGSDDDGTSGEGGADDDSSDDDSTSGEGGADDDSADDDTAEEEGGTEEPPVECPDIDDREIVGVSGEIDEDMTMTCDNVYVLEDLTYFVDGANLTIEAGVEIWGDPGSALVITNGSQIMSMGTADAPVVMTSSGLIGERAAGNWGGLVLLGEAPINTGDTANVEGIDPSEGGSLSEYGGDDEEYKCGELHYTRVEFAGFELSIDNELNGISVAGCGSETRFSHVQVHRGQDDGIEFWGGATKADHILISNASDDSIDWDSGFQGNLQFVAIIQDAADADNGFESDNNADSTDAMPRSMPTVYNLTSVGGGGNGMVLRVGTWGTIYNAILTGYGVAIDVRDAASVAGTEEDPPALTVENSIFFNNGADGETHFGVEEGDDDNDEGFDEEAFFTAEARNNQFDVDPMLGDIEDLQNPDFVPAEDSPAAEGGAEPEDNGFFDTSATYIGAFEPGGEDWTAGWTSFPEN
jgi:hypothetical protein